MLFLNLKNSGRYQTYQGSFGLTKLTQTYIDYCSLFSQGLLDEWLPEIPNGKERYERVLITNNFE